MATTRKGSTAPTPDETTPDETTPDETTPDESTPDESTPDESTPDESTPEESTPDETTSDEATSDGESAGYVEPFTDDEIAASLTALTREDLVKMQADAYKLAILISAELHSRGIDHTEGL